MNTEKSRTAYCWRQQIARKQTRFLDWSHKSIFMTWIVNKLTKWIDHDKSEYKNNHTLYAYTRARAHTAQALFEVNSLWQHLKCVLMNSKLIKFPLSPHTFKYDIAVIRWNYQSCRHLINMIIIKASAGSSCCARVKKNHVEFVHARTSQVALRPDNVIRMLIPQWHRHTRTAYTNQAYWNPMSCRNHSIYFVLIESGSDGKVCAILHVVVVVFCLFVFLGLEYCVPAPMYIAVFVVRWSEKSMR